MNLRDLMIEKLINIERFEYGFSIGLMKWKNQYFNDIHFSKLNYETLNDSDLFDFYNRVLKIHYKQC